MQPGIWVAILVPMTDVTRLLAKIDDGNRDAAEALLPLVYDELRILAGARMAHENPGQTLQATALVHEAYLRLVTPENAQRWKGRGHFFAAAAEAMRRILIERARRHRSLKRGGGRRQLALDVVRLAEETPADDLIEINDALECFAAEYPESAELVKLRFFVGLTMGEAAAALAIPRRTADRNWAFARSWLFEKLRSDMDSSSSEKSF